jgi:hypothetical protein
MEWRRLLIDGKCSRRWCGTATQPGLLVPLFARLDTPWRPRRVAGIVTFSILFRQIWPRLDRFGKPREPDQGGFEGVGGT